MKWTLPFWTPQRARIEETDVSATENEETELSEISDDFEPFTCRKCGKRVTTPSYEKCDQPEREINHDS